jgi:hypothetical protein
VLLSLFFVAINMAFLIYYHKRFRAHPNYTATHICCVGLMVAALWFTYPSPIFLLVGLMTGLFAVARIAEVM